MRDLLRSKNRHLILLQGGLGNQLYQISFAHYLLMERRSQKRVSMFYWNETTGDTTNRNNRNVLVDLVEYLGFRCEPANNSKMRFINRVKAHLPRFVSKFVVQELSEPEGKHAIFLPNPLDRVTCGCGCYYVLCYGYYQSYRYLDRSFIPRLRDGLIHISGSGDNLPTHSKTEVAVHIRRGDFLKHPDIYKYFSVDHYLEGLKILDEEEKISRVYVFSDDFEAITPELEAMETLYEVVRVEGDTVIGDMLHLTSFYRFVLANSTFSWWGAFMSVAGEDARVIVPREPLHWHNEEDEYFPQSWTRI